MKKIQRISWDVDVLASARNAEPRRGTKKNKAKQATCFSDTTYSTAQYVAIVA
jgi:hypothetical protein